VETSIAIAKPSGGGVDHAAVEVVALGEGHGVDGEVELAVLGVDLGEDVVHGLGLGHVEQQHVLDTQAGDNGLKESQGLLVLVGDDDFCAGFDAGLGNTGGDGLFVGDAGDEADLAFEIDDGFMAGLRWIEDVPHCSNH
jgi:hypothetical protein